MIDQESQPKKRLKPKWHNIIVTLLILILFIAVLLRIFSINTTIATVNGNKVSIEEFTLRYKYSEVPMPKREFFNQFLLEKAILDYIEYEPSVSSKEIGRAFDYIKAKKNLTEKELKEQLLLEDLTKKDLRELYYHEILTDKITVAINEYLEKKVYSLMPTANVTATEIQNAQVRSRQERSEFIAQVINATNVQTFIYFENDELKFQKTPQPYLFS